MRIAIHIDSASTAEIRRVAKALHQVGQTGKLEVGLDGPECWNARTPKLTPEQYREIWPVVMGWTS